MKRRIEYPITNFYVGELYLYKKFGDLLTGESIEEGENRIQKFSESGAINFQQDLTSRYIDWENKREYTGFLTIFYKQDDKYICLHDGKTYQLKELNIIDNLFLLKDLLPQIHAKSLGRISMYEALELFDLLFNKEQEEKELYDGAKQNVNDFYVGDIVLRERTPIEALDTRYQYVNLPHHLMLEKNDLSLHSFEEANYLNIVYRCLFLRDGIDLYNLHNNQFYNPNEDLFESIIPFQDYMQEHKVEIQTEKTTIPKALKYFKRTL